MRKIDFIKKITNAVGIPAELEINFFEVLCAKIPQYLHAGDYLKTPCGNMYYKRGAVKNEEMDDIDFDNTLDVITYPVDEENNLIFYLNDISTLKNHPNFDEFEEISDHIIKTSEIIQNKIVGEEFLILGHKALAALDAGYNDNLFSDDNGKNTSVSNDIPEKSEVSYDEDFNQYDSSIFDEPDIINEESKVDDEVEPIQNITPPVNEIEDNDLNEEEVFPGEINNEKIVDKLISDFDFDENEFTEVPTFPFRDDNLFKNNDTEDKIEEQKKDDFIRITEKPSFTSSDDFDETEETSEDTFENAPQSENEENNNVNIEEKEEEQHIEEEYVEKPKRSNKGFIIAAAFLIVVLAGLIIYYQMGYKLFNKIPEKVVSVANTKPAVKTIERTYEIPVTYAENEIYKVHAQENQPPAEVKPVDVNKPQEEKPLADQKPINNAVTKNTGSQNIANKETKPVEKQLNKVNSKQVNKVSKNQEVKSVQQDEGALVRQVSSWREFEKAQNLVDKYKRHGLESWYVAVDLQSGKKGIWYRVFVRFKNVSEMKSFKE